MYHITTIITSFCIVQVSVQSKQIQPRRELGIINGERTTPHDYPYSVAIMVPHFRCGGSLISRSYVLTAAHCVFGFNDVVSVILGAYSLHAQSKDGIIFGVERVVIHSGFSYETPTITDDIAMLKLRRPVKLNHFISTVRLPPLNDPHTNYMNVVATTIGWGAIEYNSRTGLYKMATALRKTEVLLTSIDRCMNENLYPSVEMEICGVGMQSRCPCRGDSGGPLMFEGIQIGIMARGDPNCKLNKSSVFTNVGKYMKWIQMYSDVRIIE